MRVMRLPCCALRAITALFAAAALGAAHAQEAAKPYEPTQGQAGRDVVWVPTPPELVEKMLDLARVTPKDFVMDLGSGDGRNVIAAAKRGARALGVEYNPDLVEYSQRLATKAGVADKAKFVQGDMYEADISQATVLALFLLTENLRKLTPKFLAMKPGSRIVSNTYEIEGWKADVTERLGGDCVSWCTAHLYIVPARVAGSWKMGNGELSFKQDFQMISGTYKSAGADMPVRNGRLHGDRITFTLGGTTYTGRVSGNTMRGTSKGADAGKWSATRIAQ